VSISLSEALQQEFNLWHYVWKLLRLRVIIYISSLRRAKLGRKIGMGILALLVIGAFGFVFFLSWLLLGFLRSPELARTIGDPTTLLQSIPVLVLAVAFLGILLTSFGVLLQALYLAGDMDFLLSAPVPIRAVFISKMLQAILPNLGLIGLFSLPVLYGLGASSGYNIFYYPLVVIVLVALALAAAGLSSLLVMGVARIFPARRVAEVLAFFGAIISLLCSQSGQLMNQFDISETARQQLPSQIGTIERLNTPISPLNWAGRSLVDIGQGSWLSGFIFLILTLGLAAAIFWFALITAERLYYTGWASLQVGTRRRRPARVEAPASQPVLTTASPARKRFPRLLPSQVIGIMSKDFTVIRRDIRNMSQIVTPLIFGIIYAFSIFRTGGAIPEQEIPGATIGSQLLKAFTVYGSVGIALFVGWSLLARLALTGFSMEGKSYWILKSAPIQPVRLLVAKYLVAYLPALVMCWAFLLVLSIIQGVSLSILIFGLLVETLCLAGLAGINLAVGIRGVNLNWEDPRKMARGTAGCLNSVISLGYLGISLVLFFVPPVFLPLLNLPEILGQGIGVVLGGLFALACALFPPWYVVRDIPNIGESS
jgi:ABC-2 type transport system permease protein